ncbi:MAG: DNA repair protein RadA, partial [Microbacterium sp.]|nr:DNA repair protein RadA [Microbacterium sp.]
MATRRMTTAAAFRCTECGWTSPKWAGRCGECQQWGTVVEAAETTGIVRSVTPVAPAAG